MVLILVVGDLHIPNRAASVPEAFKKMLVPGRVQTVLCTGNLCVKEMYEYFKTLTADVHCVKGEYDDWNKDLPDTDVIEIEDVKFGLIHGHQVVPWGDKDSLAMWQRKLDVDILLYGHTHITKTFEFDGHLFVNPGTMTGAATSFECDIAPTFVLMDVKDRTVTCFSYLLDPSGELKIKKKDWSKA